MLTIFDGFWSILNDLIKSGAKIQLKSNSIKLFLEILAQVDSINKAY